MLYCVLDSLTLICYFICDKICHKRTGRETDDKKANDAVLVKKYGYEEKTFEKYTYKELQKTLSTERSDETNFHVDGAILFPNNDRDYDAEDEESLP